MNSLPLVRQYNNYAGFYAETPSRALNLYSVFHFAFYMLYGLRYPDEPRAALAWAVSWEVVQHTYFTLFSPEEAARETAIVMASDVVTRMLGYMAGSVWAKQIKKNATKNSCHV